MSIDTAKTCPDCGENVNGNGCECPTCECGERIDTDEGQCHACAFNCRQCRTRPQTFDDGFCDDCRDYEESPSSFQADTYAENH